jgi:hypothetical protein
LFTHFNSRCPVFFYEKALGSGYIAVYGQLHTNGKNAPKIGDFYKKQPLATARLCAKVTKFTNFEKRALLLPSVFVYYYRLAAANFYFAH